MSRWRREVKLVGDEQQILAVVRANGWAALLARKGAHRVSSSIVISAIGVTS